jgi:hypothetical protein
MVGDGADGIRSQHTAKRRCGAKYMDLKMLLEIRCARSGCQVSSSHLELDKRLAAVRIFQKTLYTIDSIELEILHGT